MEQFNQLFSHLEQYKVVICKSCQFAIVPTQVSSHLASHHQEITVSIRRAIVEIIDILEDIAHSTDQIQYPAPSQPAIQGLPISRGFACTTQIEEGRVCPYICRTIQGIQKHCKQEHGWTNKQGRGGSASQRRTQAFNNPWIDNQFCQRFFEYRQWKKFFKVADLADQGDIQAEGGNNRSTQIGDAILSQLKQELDTASQKRTIDGNISRYMPNAWLDFVGWEKHLHGFVREDLLKTIKPAEDEKVVVEIQERNGSKEEDESQDDQDIGLAQACRATRRVIKKAIAICQPDIVGRSALEYINRRETGESKNEKPFYAKQKVATIKKYSQVWLKILRYIWRTLDAEKKPGYILTSKQEKYLRKIQRISRRMANEDSTSQSEYGQGQERRAKNIEEVVLKFWIAILDQDFKGSEYESGIVSGLAVLGLETEQGGWMSAMNYTPILSAIVTVSRAIVVLKAWSSQEKSIKKGLDEGLELREAKKNAPGIFELVRQMVHDFMTLTTYGGTPGPMDRILHMRTYGMKIRYTTKADARISWRGDMICIDKISFTMDDVRTVVHGLNEHVREGLVADLMMLVADSDTELPELDLGKLFDNAAEMTEGWSFLSDTRNVWAVEGERWMWRRIWKEEKMEKQFTKGLDGVESRQDIRWNKKGVEDYLRRVSRFKEELFVLVHLTAGAPARGTEVLSIQHKNGRDSRAQRGIFIDRGMVEFVTSYHKGYSVSQKVKIIHRYVPKEVGELVIYFLWLIEPFVMQLQAMVRGQEEFGSFLWEPEPEEEWEDDEDDEDDEDKEREDKERGEGEEGEEIDREARDVALIDSDVDIEAEEEQGEDIYESEEDNKIGLIGKAQERGQGLQQKQGIEPVAKNIDGFWGTDRVRRVIQKETVSRIGVKISTSIWRQVYPAIQREWTKDEKIGEVLESIYEGGKDENRRDARADQAGHSRRTEQMIYGVLVSESPFYTRSEQEGFRRVSIDWHQFLHFESALDSRGTDRASREDVGIEQRRQEFVRWKGLRETDLDKQLKRIVGQQAEFRGLQRLGLEAIMSGHARVLIVMRTGGGKSLFFMIPAGSSRDGVTIVIVPLNSLREDLKERCDKVGISCGEWDGNRPSYWASIVLVTPESAVTKAFGRFINEKKMMRQLDRIVIDECHVVLDSTREWRPAIRQLIEMTEKETQIVYLTATLPPRNEGEFLEAMGLRERDVLKLRESTTRRNVRYSVVKYKKSDEEEEVQRLVEEKKREYPLPGQIIVYCRRIKQAQRLAEVLQCKVYFREVGSKQDKRKILQSLTKGTEQVFTATNALGLGIDAPTIRVVIHVGLKEKLRDYSQESGRAGRDGFKSEAIVMRSFVIGVGQKQVIEKGGNVEAGMQEFLEGDICRRVVLDREMDGREDRVGCEIGEERCDICCKEPRGEKRRRRREDVVESEEEGITMTEGIVENIAEEEEIHRVDGLDDEFEAQVQIHGHLRRRAVEERVREGIEVDELYRAFDGWVGRCVWCKIKERDDIEHSDWRLCARIDVVEKEKMEIAWNSIGEVEFERFSGCKFCWVPQKVCHLWEEINSGGPARFRRRRGGECQYIGILRDVMAGIMVMRWGENEEKWVEDEQEKNGFEKGEIGEWDRLRIWMGKKVVISGIEMSEMCRMFYFLE